MNRIIRLTVFLAGVGCAMAQPAAIAVESFELPAAVSAAALNPMTGDIAIVSSSANQVWILPSDFLTQTGSKAVGPIAEPVNPVCIRFKRFQERSYFVVGCYDDRGVMVLDADKHQLLTHFPKRPSTLCTGLSASDNTQDPWIYISSHYGQKTRLLAFPIDSVPPPSNAIATPNQQAASAMPTGGTYEVSSSGRWLYAVDESRRIITRWQMLDPANPGAPPQAEYLSEVRAPRWEYPLVCLPHEQGLAQGTMHWQRDLTPSAEPLPAAAVCAMTGRPFLIGLANRDLRVTSLLTGRLLARMTLPLTSVAPTPQTISVQSGEFTYRRTVRPVILADEARDRIVVLSERTAQTIPLSALNLPDEPMLVADVHVPATVIANTESLFTVQPGDSRVELQVVAAPNGMRLDGRGLSWKPTSDQLGPARFTLQLRHGDAVTTHDYEVTVIGSQVTCPFAPTHAALNDTGTHLAVWQSHPPHQIGVIDLATNQLIASRELQQSILAVTMQGESICVLTSSNKEASLALLTSPTLNETAIQMINAESNVRYLENAVLELTTDSVTIHTQSGLRQQYPRPAPDTRPIDNQLAPTRFLTDPIPFVAHVVHQGTGAIVHTPVKQQSLVSYRTRNPETSATYNQRQSAVSCDAFPVRLAIQLDSQSIPGFTRVDLMALKLQRDEVLGRWPIDAMETSKLSNDLTVFLCVRGSQAVLVFGGRVYVQNLTELAAMDLPKPFRLQSEQKDVLIGATGKAQLSYSVTGGRPPYAIDVKLPQAGETTNQSPWTQQRSSTDGQFDADIEGYVKSELGAIARALVNWSKVTASADDILTAYLESVAPSFQDKTEEKATGIPVAIPVVVVARDALGQTRQLNHYLLVDLPRDPLIQEVDDAVSKHWPGTAVAADAAARVLAARGPQASQGILRYSQGWRQTTARSQMTSEQLDVAAQKAVTKCDERWQQILTQHSRPKAPPVRKWIDESGNSVSARFEQFFAGQVIVSLENGAPLVFPLEKLSESDQTYIRDVTVPSAPDPEPLEAEIVRQTQLRHIAVAFHDFHDIHSHFPPTGLVNAEGKPEISWRVLLLPGLGGQELFQLFRLDEPWDSPHNLILSKHRPAIFRAAGADHETNLTTFVRLTGPRTASPINELIRFADLKDGSSNIILAAVVDEKHAVVWTKPDDLPADAEGRFSDAFRWHEGCATIVMCDGHVRRIRQTNPPDVLFDAAIRNAGRPLRLVIEPTAQ